MASKVSAMAKMRAESGTTRAIRESASRSRTGPGGRSATARGVRNASRTGWASASVKARPASSPRTPRAWARASAPLAVR